MTTPLEPALLPTVRRTFFDPPPELAELRASPVRRLRYPDGHVGWLVTAHDVARTVLADPRFSARSELKRTPVVRPGLEPFYGMPAMPGWLVDMDPPAHSRIRRLLAGEFTWRRMRGLRPRVERIVEEHLEEMARQGPPVDLVEAFALPVPSLTICELLERVRFQRSSATLFSLQASAEQASESMRWLDDFLRDLTLHKRRHPGEDLLSRLAACGQLTTDEIAGAGVLLLTAGHETTANSLSLSTFALLCHPRQLAALRAEPALVDSAAEELFRYLTIFQFGVPRTPLEDVVIAGQVIRAGEALTVSLPAANRDPGTFRDPDRLDLHKRALGHLAFGHGAHHCLGQGLARVELRAGLLGLFRRFPFLHLGVPPEQVPLSHDMGLYGAHRLPVTW
jgi:cytochrome P450